MLQLFGAIPANHILATNFAVAHLQSVGSRCEATAVRITLDLVFEVAVHRGAISTSNRSDTERLQGHIMVLDSLWNVFEQSSIGAEADNRGDLWAHVIGDVIVDDDHLEVGVPSGSACVGL